MWEPFGTVVADGSTYWKDGPRERGTFGILSTCLITLGFCVYTSLHLNIPEQGKATWRHRLPEKALWVFIGIVAPEIVSPRHNIRSR
jgi:hypothetical protein